MGSLPRPPSLLKMMQAKYSGVLPDSTALANLLRQEVANVVARQVEIGIDSVSDGEYSKPSYATYIAERLDGFGGEFRGHAAQDLRDYPDYAKHLIDIGGVVPSAGGMCCQGPVKVKSTDELKEDLENFQQATESTNPNEAFMNAASPGVIAVFQKNEFYKSEDDYIEAVVEAMRPEYEAIVNAGFLLQLDCPDLAMGRHLSYSELDNSEFLKIAARNIEALNEALKNIPSEKIRMHICWGNYAGPHHHDIPLNDILDIVLSAKPKYLLMEGANPRHEHEWEVFKNVSLPNEKTIVPGVIDSTSNYIEHPDLVSQRICNFASVVGKDRVMAGSDCGFSTFSGYPTVHPDIVWEKLASLVEGAKRASSKL